MSHRLLAPAQQILTDLELVRQLVEGLLRALPLAHLVPVTPLQLRQFSGHDTGRLLGLAELPTRRRQRESFGEKQKRTSGLTQANQASPTCRWEY